MYAPLSIVTEFVALLLYKTTSSTPDEVGLIIPSRKQICDEVPVELKSPNPENGVDPRTKLSVSNPARRYIMLELAAVKLNDPTNVELCVDPATPVTLSIISSL